MIKAFMGGGFHILLISFPEQAGRITAARFAFNENYEIQYHRAGT